MHSIIRSFALLGLCATSTLAAVASIKETYVRCGTEQPPAELVAQAQAFGTHPVPAAAANINVKTYFHVVTTQAAKGSVTQAQLNQQVSSSLNNHF